MIKKQEVTKTITETVYICDICQKKVELLYKCNFCGMEVCYRHYYPYYYLDGDYPDFKLCKICSTEITPILDRVKKIWDELPGFEEILVSELKKEGINTLFTIND